MYFKLSRKLSAVMPERELFASLYNHAALWSEIQRGRAVFPVRAVARGVSRNFKGLSRKFRTNDRQNICEFDKWMYDNHGLLMSALGGIKEENKRFKKLPYAGETPRVFLFCRRLVAAAECNLDEDLISGAIVAFQKRTYFDYEELVYLPLAFKCAIMEYIAALICRGLKHGEKAEGSAKDALFARYGTCAASAITLLRELNHILQYDFVLKHSVTDTIFGKEKSGVYAAMREDGKGDYLAFTAYLSRKRNICETDVARAAVRLADESGRKVKNHAGYYLYNDRQALFNLLYDRHKSRKRRPKLYQRLYIAACCLPAAAASVLSGYLLWYYSGGLTGWLSAVFSFPVFIHFSKLIVNGLLRFFGRILPCGQRRPCAALDFSKGVPDEMRTAVVTSVLAASPAEMEKAVGHLAVNSFADTDPNIAYVLLVDFMPSDREELSEADAAIIAAGESALKKLRQENQNSITIFFRKRRYNGKEKLFQGWERKRGALLQLCEYYLRGADNFYRISGDKSFVPVNIAAFDADTAAFPKAVTGLIETAAHPLNLQYNIFTPRIRTNILATKDNLFTRLFADSRGFDSYAGAASDVYQDFFHAGIFHGKGLFRVKEYFGLLDRALPENRILSHDLIEGAFVGAANAGTPLYDTFPGGYRGLYRRNLRWVRGDWQLLPYLFPRVRNQDGKKRKNQIAPIAKWQIADNMLRSLLHPASLLLLSVSPLFGALFWIPLAAALSPFVFAFITDVFAEIKQLFHKKRVSCVLNGIGRGFLRLVLNLFFLPHYALCVLIAIPVTLFRMIRGKNLLKWNTFAHVNAQRKTYNAQLNACHGDTVPDPACRETCPPGGKEEAWLFEVARLTWNYFKDTLAKEYNFLPCDNYQEEGNKGFAPRTSPTNIGFGLLAAVSAAHFGFISYDEAVTLISSALATVKKLPKYKGHLYNWYEVKTLKTLYPDYVSSVDSGNFCACLLAVRGFVLSLPQRGNNAITKILSVRQDIDEYLQEIDFSCLYDARRHLFYIGYNESANKLSDSRYDLLASEAHLLSLAAMSLHKAEYKNWLHLSRVFIRYKGVSLRAWTGGMFEYLMASLLIDYKKGTLIYESNLNAARGQIRFAKKNRLPLFGISESQYNLTDASGNYQYKAFGVNAVSLKPMSVHKVISPYSGFLALEYLPYEAYTNLKRAETFGLLSDKYGFYEAADFTGGARPADGGNPVIIKSWMAHHQGMIMCALDNFLNGGRLKGYFCGDSRVAAVSLLATEKPYEKRAPEKRCRAAVSGAKKDRKEEGYFAVLNPRVKSGVNLLSGGKYRAVTDERGCGYSVFDGVCLTRRRFGKAEKYGFRFYILDLVSNEIFDSFLTLPSRAVFRAYESVYTYEWRGLLITAAASVSPVHAVELRKITVMNRAETPRDLRIASYFEPALCEVEEDAAHPVFSNLFIETEFEAGDRVIKARRNNKNAPILIHGCAGLFGVAPETSRFNFFERAAGELRSIRSRGALTGSAGFVLEPCVSLRGHLRIPARSEAEASFFTGAAWTEAAAAKLVTMINSLNFAKAVLTQARETAVKGGRENPAELRDLAYKILYSRPAADSLQKLAASRANLQSLILRGVNLNHPVIIYNVKNESDCRGLKAFLETAARLFQYRLKFNICVTYAEKRGYDKPLRDAAADAADAAGFRDGGVIFYNLATEYFEAAECLKLLAVAAQ